MEMSPSHTQCSAHMFFSYLIYCDVRRQQFLLSHVNVTLTCALSSCDTVLVRTKSLISVNIDTLLRFSGFQRTIFHKLKYNTIHIFQYDKRQLLLTVFSWMTKCTVILNKVIIYIMVLILYKNDYYCIIVVCFMF